MNSDNQNTEMNIRIDRVVLDGISLTSYEQQRLKESVETALTGLFLTNGIPAGIEKASADAAIHSAGTKKRAVLIAQLFA